MGSRTVADADLGCAQPILGVADLVGHCRIGLESVDLPEDTVDLTASVPLERGLNKLPEQEEATVNMSA